MKKLLTYALLFLLPLAACKKEYRYPEDPKKSRKSPNERLKGTWHITEYTLNGASVKDTLSKVVGADISQYTLYYRKTDEGEWLLDINGNFGGKGGYLFADDAFADFHYLVFRPYYKPFSEVFVTPFKRLSNSTAAKWVVTKLYDEDLHIQLVTDTGEYRITFIKQ